MKCKIGTKFKIKEDFIWQHPDNPAIPIIFQENDILEIIEHEIGEKYECMFFKFKHLSLSIQLEYRLSVFFMNELRSHADIIKEHNMTDKQTPHPHTLFPFTWEGWDELGEESIQFYDLDFYESFGKIKAGKYSSGFIDYNAAKICVYDDKNVQTEQIFKVQPI